MVVKEAKGPVINFKGGRSLRALLGLSHTGPAAILKKETEEHMPLDGRGVFNIPKQHFRMFFVEGYCRVFGEKDKINMMVGCGQVFLGLDRN